MLQQSKGSQMHQDTLAEAYEFQRLASQCYSGTCIYMYSADLQELKIAISLKSLNAITKQHN